MSANIDTLMYVGETPWHGLGVKYDVAPKTSKEIIEGASLDWGVTSTPVKTAIHDEIPEHHVIYRTDNNDVFGVIKSKRPVCVQNADSFNAFETLIEDGSLEVTTAASLGIGDRVFGCFELHDTYKVLDDDIQHYFVVLNDHLKADGKVTVLNTPIRVVCQNTLSAALSNTSYKARIPISSDMNVNKNIASRIMEVMRQAQDSLRSKCKDLYDQKITRDDMEKILDELFPYMKAEGNISHERTNLNTSIMRETFLTQCMGADNLGNYRGTALQVFNALTDFTQHYYKDASKGYDLNYRMNQLPGVGQPTEPDKVQKFLKFRNKLIA